MAKYGEAYDESRDPRLLYNMALCARGTRAYARTWSLLARFEREEGIELGADVRAEVDAAMAFLEQLIGKIDVDVSEGGAAVTVDGHFAGVTPLGAPLAVDLGMHALSIAKTGFAPAERRIEITAGAQARIVITLAPRAVVLVTGDAKAAARGNALAAPQIDARALGTSPARSWKRPLGWSLLGVGAGAFALGAVFGLESLSNLRASRPMCPDNRCTAEGYQENRAARTDANVADVAIAGGVAAVGCGLYLLLRDRSTARDASPPAGAADARAALPLLGSTTVAASPIPGGARLSLRGRW
jgi:hypothetical protein